MGDVEQAGLVAGMKVSSDNSVRVIDGHIPAAKASHLGVLGEMKAVQLCLLQRAAGLAKLIQLA